VDITRLLDKLEARGLVQRARPKTNRRTVLVGIAPAGKTLLTDLQIQVRDCHQRQLGHLSAMDLRKLIALLREARKPHESEGNWA
jgi:DNA-binding MarR family transcriptional regulator